MNEKIPFHAFSQHARGIPINRYRWSRPTKTRLSLENIRDFQKDECLSDYETDLISFSNIHQDFPICISDIRIDGHSRLTTIPYDELFSERQLVEAYDAMGAHTNDRYLHVIKMITPFCQYSNKKKDNVEDNCEPPTTKLLMKELYKLYCHSEKEWENLKV